MQTPSHWSSDAAALKEFRDTLVGYLVRREIIPFTADAAVTDQITNDALSRWFATGATLFPFDEPMKAVDAFTFWADHQWVETPHASTQQKLSVSISRQVGGETITLGLTVEYEITSSAALRAAFDDLRLSLGNQFAHIVPKAGQGGGSSPAPAPAPAPAADDVFPATRLTVQTKDGKVYYRVHGGRWEKFGVPIWKEVIEATWGAGYVIPDAGLSLAGYTARATMEGDRPKKITALTK